MRRLMLVGHWAPPADDPDWRVDVLAVEQAVRDAARRWRVREAAFDPFRWTRSMQVLSRDGLPVLEFPQTAARMSPATTGLREAVINRSVEHDGSPILAAHVANAVLKDDARGVRLSKRSKNSTRRIDAAVAAVMCHARATRLASRPRSRMVVLP